jgi:adenylate cyclase
MTRSLSTNFQRKSMDENKLERRLSAILAADAAGYSRLMAADDRATVIALDAARAVFHRQIELHEGRVIDMAGDSILAVFGTATGAVKAALEIQNEIAGASNDLPEAQRMLFRIGVHLGDVIVKADGTVYGDGVNIAARLQSLAEPRGITVSDAVRSAVRSNVSARFVDQGEQMVKNIPEPVRAFQVCDQADPATGQETAGVVLPLPDKPSISALSVAKPVNGFGGKPAIAVLPFENMGNDPEQAYFADGIAEDILTRLAMWRWLPVIARNSSFAYRGQHVDLKAVGAALGARYILQGSVRRSGDKIRMTGQLIDADTGHHVWAQRYDRVLTDIFELQDEITNAIVAALEPAVGAAEIVRVRRGGNHDLGAWDVYQRALWNYGQLTKESCAEACRLARIAAEQDTSFASPLALTAFVKLIAAALGWEEPQQAMREAHACVSEALQRDPLEPMALAAHAAIVVRFGNHDVALAHARKAVELNPSYAWGRYGLGFIHLLQGDQRSGVAEKQTAIRLSPNDMMKPMMLASLSACHYMAGEFQQAREIALLGIQGAPHYPMNHRSLANACGALGLLEEGKLALAKFLALAPGYNSDVARRTLPFRDDGDFRRYMHGIEQLGWKG